MSMTCKTFDTQAIRDTICGWQSDESALDGQLAESLAALEAYQSHLDAWHQDLVREREALKEAREQLERNRAELNPSAVNQVSADNIAAELESARQKIAELTQQLQARSEEIQQVKQTRVETMEKPAAEPAVERKSPPRTASPVLGSIVEQFGKLRQQRAVDRQSGKNPR
jgi:chromosome segregation ATPase